MKARVSPAPGRIEPSAAAQLSSVRTTVVPTAQPLDALDRAVVAESYRAPGLELPAGVPQREPGPVGQLAHQQELGCTTRAPGPGSRDPGPVQSRRDHAGNVEDQDVFGRDQLDDVAEPGMADDAVRALQNEQATRRAVGEGVLRDERRGEIVFEVGGVHE